MNVFSIRQLNINDWESYRNLRLESLTNHPDCFSPSRDELAFSDLDWKERLANVNAATFGLFADADLIGITGVVREGNDPESDRALFVSSYIRRDFRKRGLSKLFYEARLSWAKQQQNLRSIILEHRDDNLPSQKAHQKFGFEPIESKDQRWPDGQTRRSLVFQLRI